MAKIANKIKQSLSKGFWTGTGFALAILTTSLLAIAVTIPKTWKSGDVLTSADMNANFNALKSAIESIGGQIVVVYNSSISATTPEFMSFNDTTFVATESAKQYPMPRNLTVTNLRAKVSLNTNDKDTILTIRVNGVNSPVSITIPALTTGTFTSPSGISAAFSTNDNFSISKTYTAALTAICPGLNMLIDYEVK